MLLKQESQNFVLSTVARNVLEAVHVLCGHVFHKTVWAGLAEECFVEALLHGLRLHLHVARARDLGLGQSRNQVLSHGLQRGCRGSGRGLPSAGRGSNEHERKVCGAVGHESELQGDAEIPTAKAWEGSNCCG